MAQPPVLSIVIGSYNRYRFLKMAIESIREELTRFGISAEIIVVDGGSTDGSVRWLTKQKDIITIIQHNRGMWNGKPIKRRSWGYFMNLGFKVAQGKYICMLSDDCLVVPGAIHEGVRLFEDKLQVGEQVGGVAFFWRNWPDHSRYWVGLTFGSRMFVNHGLYLRSALEEIGFVDEDSYHFYHADGDLSLRLWERGFATIASEKSYIEHFTHTSVKEREENLLMQKQDWETYTSSWGYLGNPEKDWIEVEYVDELNTATKFKKSWYQFS